MSHLQKLHPDSLADRARDMIRSAIFEGHILEARDFLVAEPLGAADPPSVSGTRQ